MENYEELELTDKVADKIIIVMPAKHLEKLQKSFDNFRVGKVMRLYKKGKVTKTDRLKVNLQRAIMLGNRGLVKYILKQDKNVCRCKIPCEFKVTGLDERYLAGYWEKQSPLEFAKNYREYIKSGNTSLYALNKVDGIIEELNEALSAKEDEEETENAV